MKLLTKEIAKKLPKLYSQENVKDLICRVKYFTPDSSFTWYITEGEQRGDDWLLFGKTVSAQCPEGELGYISLNELQSVRGPLGLKVERDLWFNPKPLSECK